MGCTIEGHKCSMLKISLGLFEQMDGIDIPNQYGVERFLGHTQLQNPNDFDQIYFMYTKGFFFS